MFNKFRNGGKSGSKSGSGTSSDSRAGRGDAQGPRSEPPRLELPRHRSAPPVAYPQGGTPSAPRAVPDKPAHLKPVGAKIGENAWHPKLATPRAAEPQAPARPVAQPVAQPVSQPVAQTPAGGPVPARPPIPPYPVSGPAAGARAAAAPSAGPAVAAPVAATPLATNSTGAEVQSLGRLMLVGPQIRLTGEIKACERLVVEGTVEGEVSETERLEVARGGAFHGTAQVESCMIDGLFEGELDVRGVLTLRSNGRVQGTVRYGDIEIERGGRIAGAFGPRGGEAERDGTRPVRSSGPRQA